MCGTSNILHVCTREMLKIIGCIFTWLFMWHLINDSRRLAAKTNSNEKNIYMLNFFSYCQWRWIKDDFISLLHCLQFCLQCSKWWVYKYKKIKFHSFLIALQKCIIISLVSKINTCFSPFAYLVDDALDVFNWILLKFN